MSQISASADEIVPSLVMGIDEKLDQMLTPVPAALSNTYSNLFDLGSPEIDNQHPISHTIEHSARDTFTYFEYGITPREVDSNFKGYTFKEEDENNINDLEESPPQPSPNPPNGIPMETIPSNSFTQLSTNTSHSSNTPYHPTLPRSNASLLFGKPMIVAINADISDAVSLTMKNNSKQELAEQNIEYEETLSRYEKDIEELRESLNEILNKNLEYEDSINLLKEKNRKQKRREFDWTTKEKEYKSLSYS
eukprot:344846_1